VKNWLRTFGGSASEERLSVNDLMTLERFEEAEAMLNLSLKKNPRDLRAHLKLAEVLHRTGRRNEAVDQYIAVAESYVRDGFHDKGLALLAKVSKLAPNEEKVQIRLTAVREAKKLDRRRDLAIDSLRRQVGDRREGDGVSAVELQHLWEKLSQSRLLQRLDEDQIKRLFRVMSFQALDEKDVLARPGEKGDALYLIAQGEVAALYTARDGKETDVKSFGPGDIIGDSVLLQHGTWPATYRAVKASTVLKVTQSGLERALAGNPDPRALLDSLREQGMDLQVEASIRRMETRST